MRRHVLFVLALSFISFYCVTLTWGALGTAGFSGFLRSRQCRSTRCLRVVLGLCRGSSVKLSVAQWQREDVNFFFFNYFPPICWYYADIALLGLAWGCSTRISCSVTTGTNISYHMSPVCSSIFPQLICGFPFLHGMVTILNRFSSAGFGVCSSSVRDFKFSNYFPAFYLSLINFLCL